MIIFNDFKERFYNEILQAQNVVIVPYTDVDAVCATFILTRLLDADEITYSVIPVTDWNQLKVVFDDHKQSVKHFVLLNCGGFRSLLDFQLPSDFRVFVIDARRPFNLDNVFNEETIRIVCQETEVKELNLPRVDEIFNEDDSDVSSDEGDEGDENRLASFAERVERRLLKRKRLDAWRQNREQILWKYNHKSYISTPTSVFLLSLAHSMTKTAASLAWSAAVGLSSFQVDHSISTMAYSKICIQTMKPYLRQFGLNNKNKVDPTLRITFEKELSLPLYRHWTLDESIRLDIFFMTACKLWTQRGGDKIRNVYANLGIPLNECQNSFERLPSQRRKEIFEIINNYTNTTFASFFSHKGYARWFSSADFARAVALKLQFSDPIKPHTDLFMQALDFLRDFVDQDGGTSTSMTAAINDYKSALRSLTALAFGSIQQKHFIQTPAFIGLTIKEYCSELDYLRSTHCLNIFLYIAIRVFHAAQPSNRRLMKPFFVAVLNPNLTQQQNTLDDDMRYYMCSGCMPLGDIHSDEARKSFIPRIFEEIAADRTIHSIYDSIDPNVIFVRNDSYAEFFSRLDTRLPAV